jgi:predicted transposase YdaD
MAIVRYLDPRNDAAFKNIFGTGKGIKEGELRIAKALQTSGMPIEQICQITGLSKDELS